MTNLALAVLAWMIWEKATTPRRNAEYKERNRRVNK